MEKESMRSLRHRLRNRAGAILGFEARTGKCGKVRITDAVSVFRSRIGSRYAGVTSCGSIWACPVCASKISEGRQAEVQAACERHQATGGSVYMATFTVPHNKFQKCADLRAGIAHAWRKMQSGGGWLRIKSDFEILGSVRALEVTHGDAGWHPHLHVLIFLKAPVSEVEEYLLKDRLFNRWENIIFNLGLGQCSVDAFDLVQSRDGPEAAHYVAKWGAGSEITKGSSKRARFNNCAPWELLARADWGDEYAGELFREYYFAFHGARQLTWSVGLKQHYDIHEVAEDVLVAREMELAQGELSFENTLPEGRIGIFSKACWDAIVERKLTAVVLDIGHESGWPGITAFLSEEGIKNEYEAISEALPQPPSENASSRQKRRAAKAARELADYREFTDEMQKSRRKTAREEPLKENWQLSTGKYFRK